MQSATKVVTQIKSGKGPRNCIFDKFGRSVDLDTPRFAKDNGVYTDRTTNLKYELHGG